MQEYILITQRYNKVLHAEGQGSAAYKCQLFLLAKVYHNVFSVHPEQQPGDGKQEVDSRSVWYLPESG